MSESKTEDGLPLALAILSREHAEIRQALDGLAADPREARAAAGRVLRLLDLEAEVLTPALRRAGWPTDDADAAALRAAAEGLQGAGSAPLPERAAALRREFESYAGQRERELFPWAVAHLGDDLAALAVEMEEARERLAGAYGVG